MFKHVSDRGINQDEKNGPFGCFWVYTTFDTNPDNQNVVAGGPCYVRILIS
jgi:hypothetical protein